MKTIITPEELAQLARAADKPEEMRGRPEKYTKYVVSLRELFKKGFSVKKAVGFIKNMDGTVSESSLTAYILREKLNKVAEVAA